MKIRTDIADLLRAGHSDREISRVLHLDNRTIAAVRTELGLPRHKSGIKAAGSPRDLFRQRTRPVDGGHLEWTGYVANDGTPFFRWNKRGYTAGRMAFGMQHGRAPVGRVRPGCGHLGCVAPSHVEDQPMRDQLKRQLAGIFGGAA
ncbi:hypothetical protein ACFWNT_11075 [Streptomyces sp. NPDC058409]|uniref:hypothetical protein n=1 Tax=Streptomyces sp. NPDC058409 TaxID=3346484 RepID=UPI0036499C0F